QEDYSPAIEHHYSCPTCQSPLDDIKSGRELKISRLDCRELSASQPVTAH
ncbi:MAG: hydrogenase maturation nickel metallochaperone HypA, partial [Cyanobacteria bacterium P01_G01_bin.4]